MLNGHEWVAKEAARQGLAFTTQDDCFTELSNGPGRRLPDAARSIASAGRAAPGLLHTSHNDGLELVVKGLDLEDLDELTPDLTDIGLLHVYLSAIVTDVRRVEYYARD